MPSGPNSPMLSALASASHKQWGTRMERIAQKSGSKKMTCNVIYIMYFIYRPKGKHFRGSTSLRVRTHAAQPRAVEATPHAGRQWPYETAVEKWHHRQSHTAIGGPRGGAASAVPHCDATARGCAACLPTLWDSRRVEHRRYVFTL